MIFIVYSESTGCIRRVVCPADGKTVPETVPGESVLEHPGQLSKDDYLTIPSLQQYVLQTTGKQLDDRPVAVLDVDGKIKDLIQADPVIDHIHGYELKHAPKWISHEDKFDRGTGEFVKKESPKEPTKPVVDPTELESPNG